MRIKNMIIKYAKTGKRTPEVPRREGLSNFGQHCFFPKPVEATQQ
jgi:hypothetical protein